MQGLLQYQPLLLSDILEHGARTFPHVPIVSWTGTEAFRYDYREAARRARRLASVLPRLGIKPGDFVGGMAWTTHRHFELMYAVPGVGAALHTINPRLSGEHIVYSINHAHERVMFVDPDCVPLMETLAPLCTAVDCFVVMSSRAAAPPTRLPNVYFYEDLIDSGDDAFTWPSFDERAASTACFTSGTTGNPKGVVYSHRGTYLSAMAIAAPNVWGVSHRDAIIVLAPFFHCNAWGATYLGPMAGAKLILPGRDMDGRSLQRLIVDEGATVGPGVPTVWLGIAEYCRSSGAKLGSLNRIVCGGAAPPLALMRTFWREYGVRTIQVWGMTETTHAATVVWTDEDVLAGVKEPRAPQGQPVFGTQIRVVSDAGQALPKDGVSAGQLQVRAHWCASGYLYRDDVSLCDREGWLHTGDLAVIGEDDSLKLTDRLKDVIKSGGEWVSSVDLENAAIGHPSIAEAAVIGIPHPRWQERPLMYVVLRPGHEVSPQDLRTFLSQHVAKWWLPEEIVYIDELPHNSTGKVQKEALRELYRKTIVEAG